MKALLIILGLFVAYGHAQNVLIENINIVDVTDGTLKDSRHILIENGRIAKVSRSQLTPKDGTTVIDGNGKYAMPGMVDTHIHFFQTGSIYTRPDALDMTDVKSYEDELTFAMDMVPDSFQRYLRVGVTSIMDVGGPFSNFKVRDSITPIYISPNVFVTGPLFSPYQPEALSQLDDVPIVKITSIAEATKLFNTLLERKPDFIKVWYIANNSMPAEATYPIVAHIAALCRDNNLKLAVHATQKKTAELAVKAGADILVHSIDDEPATAEFATLLKENDVTYIPTLIVSKNYVKSFLGKPDNHFSDLYFANPETYRSLTYFQKYDSDNVPANVRQVWDNETRINEIYDERIATMNKSLLLLQKAGVTIATGTDAGNIGTMHASSYIQEQEAMWRAGLSVAEILKASTINAAKGFGLDGEIGSVTEGKKADILVLDENPLAALKNLNSLEMTIKDGVVLPVSNLITESPEQVVQRQVNAYNARDIDAFMDTYADTIKIYNFPDQLSMDGKKAMRAQFAQMFENVPNLYCEIKNRMVLGNKVVDREYVRFGEQYSSVIAIYEVTDGKISKVTFLR